MLRTEASRKRIYFWNAAGSAIYALSSFLMLMIVVRWCGEEEAGVFSIGYAIAQLMLTIGIFEATVYFATDIKNRFSSEQYLAFKIITCLLMVVISAIYVLYFGFDIHKTMVAYALCAFRLVEAMTQYFYGAFQKHERLDLGGFSTACRMLLAMSCFAFTLIITRDVVWACILATLVELLWLLLYDVIRLRKIIAIGQPDFSPSGLMQLFLACLPMFLSSFLAAYLNNVAKYAIENMGTDTMQAIFNILFMPAFIVNLFMIFVMRPSLTTLANHWADQEAAEFMQMLRQLLLIAFAISLSVVVICAVVGIPILQWFYGVELTGMTTSLLIVMLGGGFASASNVLYNALVVIRFQKTVPIAYLIAILIATLVAKPLVASMGIMGACTTYCIACGSLLIAFLILFIICYRYSISKFAQAV